MVKDSNKEEEKILIKRKTKLIKVFTDKVKEEPTFLITYQTYQDSDNGKSEIIREKVHITNANSRHRYYGQTPVVFIRREHEKDINMLNLANLIKSSLDNAQNVLYERDIKNAIKIVLKAYISDSQIKKLVFYDVYGEIVFKRPDKDFITFTHGMFRKVANDIVAKVVNGEVKESE